MVILEASSSRAILHMVIKQARAMGKHSKDTLVMDRLLTPMERTMEVIMQTMDNSNQAMDKLKDRVVQPMKVRTHKANSLMVVMNSKVWNPLVVEESRHMTLVMMVNSRAMASSKGHSINHPHPHPPIHCRETATATPPKLKIRIPVGMKKIIDNLVVRMDREAIEGLGDLTIEEVLQEE